MVGVVAATFMWIFFFFENDGENQFSKGIIVKQHSISGKHRKGFKKTYRTSNDYYCLFDPKNRSFIKLL